MVDQIIKNFYESAKNFDQNEKSIVWKNHQINKFSNINEEKLRNFRNNGLARGADNSYFKKTPFFSLKDLNECFIEFNTSCLFNPVIISVPLSIPSGLSCIFLIVTAGKFKIDDSSVIVPLSEITNLELICKFT